MKSKNHNRLTLTIVVGIVMITLVNVSGLVSSANAQGAEDAYFTGVEYSLKVYEWTQDKWNFTVYNENCAVDIWGRAWFFFKFYLNGSLWWDEYTEASTWQLNKNSSTTRTYTVTLGSGPVIKDVKIELYWDYEGTPYLQDTVSFTVKVVNLSVEAWSPSSLTVEKGKTTASTLSISFKNGGNDYMYETSIQVTDADGLQISPETQNLGDIASKGTKTTSFSVTAPITATLGTHTVSFKISYNDFRGVSHSETKMASIDVTKLSTSINLSLQPSSLKIGASTTITAKLTDGNNIALTNKEISFSIGTTPIGTANTDSSGNAIRTYTANVDAGTYTIKAFYAGSADYGSTSATSNLIVILLDTTLTINAPSVKVGTTATITATLKDENGNPVSDANIDFYLFENNAWSKISSATTNAVGSASITRTFNTAEDYQIKIVYAGSTNYNSFDATATLTISQFTTTCAIGVPSATVGKECTLKTTLKDENGNAMQNIDIDFYIYEENAWKKIGSAKTDSDGVACLKHTPSSTGTFQVKAVFSGTTNYAQSSSTSADLNVAMDYTPYYLGGGIIAVIIIGLIGYMLFRRRRKKTALPVQ